jgi:hypothetical protein
MGHPDPHTWVAHPHRRLAIYRDGRLLWHSHVTGGTDEVALGHGRIAFTVWRHDRMSLWLAPVGGRERIVARNEDIVGWTAGGLVTQRRADVRLRGRDGRFLRSLGKARTAFRDGDDVVILRTDGVIVRTDGLRSRVVADLRPLGMGDRPWLDPLDGGLMQLSAGNRVLLLDRDGRPFASIALARAGKRDPGGTIAGNVVPLPDRSAVLFVVNRRKTWKDPGVMTVYRLDRGHRVPRPLFVTRVQRLTCGEWGGLAYRRGRVLFASDEAGIAILDPAGRARPIDLTRLSRRLLPSGRHTSDIVFAVWG